MSWPEVQEDLGVESWPAAVAHLRPLFDDLAWSTVNIVDRWTRQHLYVLCHDGWRPEEQAPYVPEDERPRAWVGPHVVWSTSSATFPTGGYLVDARGVRRTGVLHGEHFELVRLGLAAEVLGPAAPADLRSLVSLCLTTGYLSWVGDRTGPATG